MNLDTLTRIAQEATPGPWEFSDTTDGRGHKGEFRAPDPHNGFMLIGPWVHNADIDFIATFDPPTILKLLAVVRAAERWWLNKRPVQWAEEEHLRNPTINCSTDAECRLAEWIAKLVSP